MNKMFLSTLFVCLFFNTFSMEKNPCSAWVAMMKLACKTRTLNAQTASRLEAEVAKAGCQRTDMVENKDLADLFKQAGAQVQCPYLYTMQGSFPVYNYQKCQYTKFFDKK